MKLLNGYIARQKQLKDGAPELYDGELVLISSIITGMQRII